MELGRIPPNDVEAEQAILGCMLTDKDSVIAAMETLKEELEDMEAMVKEDLLDEETNDAEVEKLNQKIKELEQQIVKIVSMG